MPRKGAANNHSTSTFPGSRQDIKDTGVMMMGHKGGGERERSEAGRKDNGRGNAGRGETAGRRRKLTG